MDKRIAVKIDELLAKRKAGASICPSEVARALADPPESWRDLMEPVRERASELHRRGTIEICQKGVAIDPTRIKGPIRLRYPLVKDGKDTD